MIKALSAQEILDSRGRPTIEVRCELMDDFTGIAQVPSGASTGGAEAVELRDADPARYRGLGCRKAAANVTGPIMEALRHRALSSQQELDTALIEADGTGNKSRLGGNAILGVSLAFARAMASREHKPLYQYFAEMIGNTPSHLPRLTINLFSGGKHAGGQVPVQDVLVIPAMASTIEQGLAQVAAVYEAAADHILARYQMRRLTADEGGLAPPFAGARAMFDDAVKAITSGGFKPGREISLAVDVAASHFAVAGGYQLGNATLNADRMLDTIDGWVSDYPLISVEDGLSEEDWPNWPRLRQRLDGRALTLGDDLLCTNPSRIRRAIDTGACDALLLKVNQIGTLTEAALALHLARDAGWKVTVSARSGETEDTWLADLAVGWSADQIKVGSITQSERLAKYNRLLTIERETGLPVVGWPN
ncbi:MAG: phosphopyruvate hydratase [Proteobacteria bacterium]|nr:phosphopyruvate hydratase [Pseudomonadota bacterium]